jgi:MFS transporter, ACS family, solute carrier family 17 (sodium-dependent inorganic phosphate cotransporter), member 5
MIIGAKIVLAGAILIGSILTILIPVAARLSYIALFACRFFTGVAHGVFWPAMSSLWSKWAPPAERSRLVGVANAGAQIGNVIALPLSGWLCVNGFDGGWPSIFYIFGAIGIVWFIVWMIFGSKSPSENRFIGVVEKKYLEDKIKTNPPGKTPWLDIIKSKSFWGLVIAHFSSNFGTYLFLTQLPTYMREILKFDIKSNGALSALPYIVFWFAIILSSIIGDKLIESKKLTKTVVRKIFNSLGLILPMSAVIGLCFVDCSIPYAGVALLTYGLATT